ncbi:MAG: IS3 family transposase [Sphingobacteriales bacterium]|nr:MAG: IS3 family transposase [Sphingobacteriales bacterium]
MNRQSACPISIQVLCKAAGISRQALHKHQQRELHGAEAVDYADLFESVDRIRREHPRMGARMLYELVRPQGLGRDRFERLLLEKGYRVHYAPPFIHHTKGVRHGYAPNLIEGKTLRDINQVWQSDITYVIIGSLVYYLSLVTDVYSRRIVGYHFCGHYRAEGCVTALKMALSLRKGDTLDGLIHHSDRGSQYNSSLYKSLLKRFCIQQSMCKEAYENAYEERLHRTLKYDYIYCWPNNNQQQLEANVKRAIRNYNFERPHSSLGKKPPVQFEKYLNTLIPDHRPPMKIFSQQEHDQQKQVF